jgi:hypothetical protein
MEAALNNTQLEILNLFSDSQSEEDLKEIKSLLITYLSDKLVREADKAADAKHYINIKHIKEREISIMKKQ